MKLIEIVADYVEKNNYDGLYNPHAECACKKSDLMPLTVSAETACRATYSLKKKLKKTGSTL